MASGRRGAKKHGMGPEEVDEFMEECSELILENDDSEPRRSIPAPMPWDSRPDVDKTLHKDTSEIWWT